MIQRSTDKQIFRFRIELRDIAPPIWREIEVMSGYSFWDLRVAIQDVMGWLDYHLHAFRLTDTNEVDEYEIGIPIDDNSNLSESPELGELSLLPLWEDVSVRQ